MRQAHMTSASARRRLEAKRRQTNKALEEATPLARVPRNRTHDL